MNEIEEMNISELSELLNIVKGIISKHQEELTTYARMNSDPTFEKISIREKNKFDRVNEFVKLREKIEHTIEDLIYNEYIK